MKRIFCDHCGTEITDENSINRIFILPGKTAAIHLKDLCGHNYAGIQINNVNSKDKEVAMRISTESDICGYCIIDMVSSFDKRSTVQPKRNSQ